MSIAFYVHSSGICYIPSTANTNNIEVREVSREKKRHTALTVSF